MFALGVGHPVDDLERRNSWGCHRVTRTPRHWRKEVNLQQPGAGRRFLHCRPPTLTVVHALGHVLANHRLVVLHLLDVRRRRHPAVTSPVRHAPNLGAEQVLLELLEPLDSDRFEHKHVGEAHAQVAPAVSHRPETQTVELRGPRRRDGQDLGGDTEVTLRIGLCANASAALLLLVNRRDRGQVLRLVASRHLRDEPLEVRLRRGHFLLQGVVSSLEGPTR